ncbi:MAG: esterase family protein [Tomitella sp.]|nr:esterase family protein [Tomitella sp.]
MKRFRRAAWVLTATMVVALVGVPSVAAADDNTTLLAGEQHVNDRLLRLEVYSPSMDRDVPVMVQLPARDDSPHGVYYLLDGNSGQIESSNWLDRDKGDAAAFFADKDVYAVFPVGGTGTLYTDWQQEHPKFGTVKWETFLTKELPPVIDARFNTNGHNAIGGISSGAEGALMLAERNPGLYQAVAGYSGCYNTVDPVGRELTGLVVINGGATAEMMWGPYPGPGWQSHDIFANAAGLRGTTVYLSSGNGLPGPHETLDVPQLERRIVIGGLLEAGSNMCTNQLVPVLQSEGVDVIRSAQPVGEHDWPYWRDELARSWPVIEARLR